MGFKYLVLILFNVYAKFSEVSVDAEEIHLLENESLELICNGSYPKFIYPTSSEDSKIPTSSVEIIEDRERGSVLLRRNKTVYGDTGWYGCFDSYDFPSNLSIGDEYTTPDNYYMINPRWAKISVKWTYVYVKSSEHFFVEPWDMVKRTHVNTDDDAVLLCHSTSPDYTVRLFRNNQEINLNSRVSFDPRRGFSLKKVTIKDSGYYRCAINKSSEEVNHYLHVMRKIIPSKPVLRVFSWERLIVDKELAINCSIETPGYNILTLEWKTPKSSKINFELFVEEIGNGLIRYTNKLTIQNFTHDEEGIYECNHSTPDGYNITSINITLADAELHLKTKKLINLKGNKKNYTNADPIPVFVGLNCSDKAEFSPAAVESLNNSIINEIKRNLTDIISNAVKDSFEKYLMSVFSSLEPENPLIFSKLDPVIPPYYSTPRSYQNSIESITDTIPYYYPTESKNSTERSVTETDLSYFFSPTNQNSSEPEYWEGEEFIFPEMEDFLN